MRRFGLLALLWMLAVVAVPASVSAREAKLVRYPHYHQGKITFSYLGDLWTADESGRNIQRLTAHKARDIYPRFSPDGKWIAFSSDRNGNLDVFVIPVEGGAVKPLTVHSADDMVLGWSPDAKTVLFASNRGEEFMGKLYVVGLDGSLPRDAGPDMGVYGGFSPDGQKLALNRKSQPYWRKAYRGAYQSDVTVMDLCSRTFKDLTTFDGMDTWPMWGRDGHIYFVSDRQGNGLTNLWRVPGAGGEAERVTSFTGGDVRWPAISGDGATIVFEHDFGIWKLDVASREARPIPLEIAAETQENLTEYRDFNAQVDQFDLAPNGRRIAFTVHGEVFTAPTGEGDLVQITDGPAREQNVDYSPDGKWIAYISDASGQEEIYVVAADGSGPARKITNLDALITGYEWSPDSKKLALGTFDGKLFVCTAEGKDLKELASSKYGPIRSYDWSPDGTWLAITKADASRTTNIYLIPASGGEAKKVTFDSDDESNPHFSADGTKLYFVREEGSPGFGERPSSQIFVVPLERQETDPDDPEAGGDSSDSTDGSPEAMIRRMATQRRGQPPRAAKIDWPGLKRRTRQITRMPSPVFDYLPGADSRTLIFVAADGTGPRSIVSLYTIQDDGKRLNRLAVGTPRGDGEGSGGPRGSRGFFGGRISHLALTRDGRTLYFQEGDSVYSVPVTGGGGPGGGGLAAALAAVGSGVGGSGSGSGSFGGGRRKIDFTARVKVDRPAEWAEMFDDAWRTMKYRFYDPKMHGSDWDALRAKYQPLVTYVGDRHELLNLINEMIGELNASHTGAAPGERRNRSANGDGDSSVATGHLGIELEADAKAGLYRVSHIYEEGPADKDWVKVAVGDYVLALDGKPLKAGDNYWERLNHRLNRRVQLTLSKEPPAAADEADRDAKGQETPKDEKAKDQERSKGEEKAQGKETSEDKDQGSRSGRSSRRQRTWKARIDPVSMAGYRHLRYDEWVRRRRRLVDERSHGRVGYLHIQAMDQASLRKFEKELREFRNKEALIIDERFNGGGNIEQELLAILVQRPYQVWRPRGVEPTHRPFEGYFGPKAVLQNWRSASNAEMFPAGFRALGLGKVIGTPTMGAVIGTGSYTLIDGSTIRTPGVGVFLADDRRTNMENLGVQPDIRVENSPEDNLAGRDRQVEVAVDELLKELKEHPKPSPVAEIP